MALALAGAAQPAAALDTDPPVVDESPALTIGDFEVSRYILDKNYNQFLAAHRAKSGAAPSKDAISAWFRLFIARQAIHARLVEEGYPSRPEVQRETDRMARQILTQTDGPLYQSLIPAAALTPAHLRKLHETSARVFDIVAVRFDDAATADKLMGPVTSPGDFARRAKELTLLGQNSGFDLYEGPSIWPYGAFQEIADVIPEAQPETVVGPVVRALGVYHLLVRSESKHPLPDFEATRGEWERYVRWTYQNFAQRGRRRQILRDCEFQPDPAAAARLASRLRPRDGQPHTIDENATLAGSEETLATYVGPDGRCGITDRDFVRHFNQRIIRSMPRGPASLVTTIEDIVVEEHDYATAIAARLNREPKFAQDRRNFELKEALTLYENEVLVPRIEISPDELQSYYSKQGDRYAVTSEAEGMLYRFPTLAEATEALRLLHRGESSAPTGRAEAMESVVVRRAGPPLAPDRPNAVIIALPDGRAFGPFDHLGRPAIFVKRSTGERRAPPLAEIEPLVRQDLLRDKLDDLQIELFRQGSGRALHVHFEFSKYGIENPFEGNAGTPGTSAVAQASPRTE